MYKLTTTYVVSPKTRLDKIMPVGVPINAFIDKGRCGIGATYGEIKNKDRCTLIAVPNISILLCKQKAHPEIDIVYGLVSYQDIKQMLMTSKTGHKIMTTPEGMRRIMKAAEEVKRYDEIVSEWFLLLDEVHTFVSEAYREDILAPFDYFWQFKNKSIISATPYEFSDERFKSLHHYRIKFEEKLGKVTLVKAKSVVGTLDYILQNCDEFPGNLHIFYNSVTQIVAAIKRARLTIEQCNIFCADDKDGKNMQKLGELINYFVAEPKDGIYKKINFYTSKYFEGWDLRDINATMILVTDKHRPQTCVGASTKGKQAFGRLRSGEIQGDKPYQLIHITDHKGLLELKPLVQFKIDFREDARLGIDHWNERVAHRTKSGMTLSEKTEVDKYADRDTKTKIAQLNLMKLDQQINEAANNEIYNHINFIKQDWEDGYFNVELLEANHVIENKSTEKRKSKAKQLEEDYLKLKEYKGKKANGIVFSIGQSIEDEIKSRNPTAYQAHELLDEATMIKLKYNVKRVDREIILKENTRAELKLAKLLKQEFKPGNKGYTNQHVKCKLQEMYNSLNIRSENGKVRIAAATHLEDNGWFQVETGKVKNSRGIRENGLRIIRANFNILMAA
ncbi:hypothetical protein FHW88_005419 [Mucilaginibacter sp. SG538B]|uniref:DEAD/DEAH box helicase family protein n=1 Tax=unclassified Mucilaginibacter TaxID=2617802 RepID=UPI0008716039|nr:MULTISPECIES: DEAD/DEAH box helicase family protein [unclassified Mucilaginibacter]NVM67098.1 hypothetical protein [Mucilaginibacter sp. SG538B]SCW88310.1 hypothetical protein SAMN03159284_05365 [Mucilaginibacter sp. NFR10]